RLLAVVADVDPRRALLLDHPAGRRGDERRELGRVDRLATALPDEHLGQRLGPRQAAGVGGQDAALAPSHAAVLCRALLSHQSLVTRASGWVSISHAYRPPGSTPLGLGLPISGNLVQTAVGVTQRVLGEMGIPFLILSTTANLLDGGVTPGRQVYMVNLFKRPAEPVLGQATWFPTRGIPPL